MDVIGGFSEVGSATNALDKAKAAEAAQTATDAGSAAFLGSSGPIDKTPRFKLADVGKTPGKLSTLFNPKGAQEWAKSVRSALADQAQLQNEFTLRSSLAGIDNQYRLGQIDKTHANALAEQAVDFANKKKLATDQFYFGQKLDPNAISPEDSETVKNYKTYNNPTRNRAIEAGNVADQAEAIEKGLRADLSSQVLSSPEGAENYRKGALRAPLLPGEAQDVSAGNLKLRGDEFGLHEKQYNAQQAMPLELAPGATLYPRSVAMGLTQPTQIPFKPDRMETLMQQFGNTMPGNGMRSVNIGGREMFLAPTARYSGSVPTPEKPPQTEVVPPRSAPQPVRAPMGGAPAMLPQQQPNGFLGIPYRQPTNVPPGGDALKSVLQSLYGIVEPNTRDQLERNYGSYIWSR